MAIETGGKHAPRHGHGADLRALAAGDGQAFVDGLDRYAPAVALLAGDALQRHRASIRYSSNRQAQASWLPELMPRISMGKGSGRSQGWQLGSRT
jgi:hypothetical protein